MLPHLSEISEAGKMAIRVKPTSILDKDKTWYKHDLIYWSRGEPVNLGHQYEFGEDSARRYLGKNRSWNDAIEAYQNGDYEMVFSRSLAEVREIFNKTIFDVPKIKLDDAKHALRIEARNAGWPAKLALVEGVV